MNNIRFVHSQLLKVQRGYRIKFWGRRFWELLGKPEPDNSPWRDYLARQEISYERFLDGLKGLGLNVDSAGGQCPVQVEGSLIDSGKVFYFRARGESWALTVSDDFELDEGFWTCGDDWGDYPFQAGYMPMHVVLGKIEQGLKEYREAIAG